MILKLTNRFKDLPVYLVKRNIAYWNAYVGDDVKDFLYTEIYLIDKRYVSVKETPEEIAERYLRDSNDRIPPIL